MVEFRGGKEKEKWDYFISKNKNVLIVLHVCARACVCLRACARSGTRVEGQRTSCWCWLLSLLYVDPRAQTRVILIFLACALSAEASC